MKGGDTDSAVAAALAGYDAARQAYCDLQARLASGEDPVVIGDAVEQMARQLTDLPQACDVTTAGPAAAARLATQAQAASDACRALLQALEEARRHQGAAAQQEARQAKAVRGYLHETRTGQARYLDTEG